MRGARRACFYVAAALVRARTPLRIAHRDNVTDPKCARYYKDRPDVLVCEQHAEMAVLFTELAQPGDDVVVLRWTSDGMPACSKPCEICAHLLHMRQIKRVTFFDESGTLVTHKVSHLPKVLPQRAVMLNPSTLRALRALPIQPEGTR